MQWTISFPILSYMLINIFLKMSFLPFYQRIWAEIHTSAKFFPKMLNQINFFSRLLSFTWRNYRLFYRFVSWEAILINLLLFYSFCGFGKWRQNVQSGRYERQRNWLQRLSLSHITSAIPNGWEEITQFFFHRNKKKLVKYFFTWKN